MGTISIWCIYIHAITYVHKIKSKLKKGNSNNTKRYFKIHWYICQLLLPSEEKCSTHILIRTPLPTEKRMHMTYTSTVSLGKLNSCYFETIVIVKIKQNSPPWWIGHECLHHPHCHPRCGILHSPVP